MYIKHLILIYIFYNIFQIFLFQVNCSTECSTTDFKSRLFDNSNPTSELIQFTPINKGNSNNNPFSSNLFEEIFKIDTLQLSESMDTTADSIPPWASTFSIIFIIVSIMLISVAICLICIAIILCFRIPPSYIDPHGEGANSPILHEQDKKNQSNEVSIDESFNDKLDLNNQDLFDKDLSDSNSQHLKNPIEKKFDNQNRIQLESSELLV